MLSMVDTKSNKYINVLEESIKEIEGVNEVFSIIDILDTTIPIEMLPKNIEEKINKNNETIILVTFTVMAFVI